VIKKYVDLLIFKQNSTKDLFGQHKAQVLLLHITYLQWSERARRKILLETNNLLHSSPSCMFMRKRPVVHFLYLKHYSETLKL